MADYRWVIEVPDEESEMTRILKVADSSAELKYVAVSLEAANDLVTALDWFESFRTGMVGLPKPKRATRKSPPRKS